MQVDIIFFLIILIFSIILHEVAHGYVADWLGDPTARLAGRLTLNPIPHVDLMGSIILPALLVFTHSPILFGWGVAGRMFFSNSCVVSFLTTP